ncbi:MAG TPA: hypothetical protein VMD59_11725 [Acidimicrobiales bacterium]|nr:hypothetical protein [Acidimicrobiales bacterium]
MSTDRQPSAAVGRVRTVRLGRVHLGTPRQRRSGSILDCLVLAPGPEEWAAVDLASGAFVRARPPGPDGEPPLGRGWQALDVARIEITSDGEPLDPARPEAIACGDSPIRLGRARRGAARRLLRRLASPERPGATLLASHGPSIPYVDLDGTTPSLMLIAVAPRSLEACSRGSDDAVLAFSWSGGTHQLPVAEDRLRRAVLAAAPRPLSGSRLAGVLGGKPSLVLVGLGAVRGGHTPKQVLAVLGL